MTTLITAPATSSSYSAAAVRPARPGHRVPWSTVLPLAVVLAYADGFWTTSLRGAVGAISRTQEPFASFWRTSTLTLPVFVLAVLAAVTWALRRFGPEPQSRRARVVTGLLVAGAATAVALALSLGSAAYDFHLQSGQLTTMQSMVNDCDTACLGRQRAATVAAHGLAIAYTGIALLVTNVVLVGWVVALRGGGLRLVAPSRSRVRRAAAAAGGPAQELRLLVAAGLLASAVIHAAVVPEHLEEWWAAGVFFVVLTSAEVVAAAGLLVARPRTGPAAAAPVLVGLVSAVPLVVWAASRTAGLPFGPEAGTPEPVGLADVVACLLEVGTLVAAVVLLRRRDRALRPPRPAHHRAMALAAVVAVGALGLGAAAPAWFDGLDEPVAAGDAHHG